jgi:hypothetical protein
VNAAMTKSAPSAASLKNIFIPADGIVATASLISLLPVNGSGRDMQRGKK